MQGGGVFVEGERRDTRDLGTTGGLAAAACMVVLLCHVVFCRVRRGREAGYPGHSGTLGTTGGLAAAVCRVGLAGGLFLKSDNPNLSVGEKV